MKSTSALVALLLTAAAGSPSAAAAGWSMTDAWLLHGNDFELGAPERDILRLEHADGWAYGDNYFFVDSILSEDAAGADQTTMYGEFAPRFSLGKISDRELGAGPVTDLLLAVAINTGDDFRAYLYGAGIDLAVPGFSYFQLNVYVRDDRALPGETWQITPCWRLPLKLGPLQGNLQGFIDWAGAEGPARQNLLIVPRLWLDVGALWGEPGHLEAGVEYLYWKNKFGVDGVTEKVLQPALRWTF